MVLLTGFCFLGSSAQAATLKLDTTKTKVTWTGKKVTGEHTGLVVVKSGTMTVEGTKLKSGTVTIDMTKITCTDLADAEWNKKLVDHLNGDDFFSTQKFKEAKLTIKSVEPAKGGDFTIVGDLTIKGKTLPISFPATITTTEKTLKGNGTLTFDRTAYDIKYNSGKFFQALGDKMINDEVSVKIEFEAMN